MAFASSTTPAPPSPELRTHAIDRRYLAPLNHSSLLIFHEERFFKKTGFRLMSCYSLESIIVAFAVRPTNIPAFPLPERPPIVIRARGRGRRLCQDGLTYSIRLVHVL